MFSRANLTNSSRLDLLMKHTSLVIVFLETGFQGSRTKDKVFISHLPGEELVVFHSQEYKIDWYLGLLAEVRTMLEEDGIKPKF